MEPIDLSNEYDAEEQHPYTEDIQRWTAASLRRWREDPAIMHSDLTRFHGESGMPLLDTMTVAFRHVVTTERVNRLVARRLACQWTLARAAPFLVHMPQTGQGVVNILDVAMDYVTGQAKEVPLREAHAACAAIYIHTLERFRNPIYPPTMNTLEARLPAIARAKALCSWTGAALECTNPDEFPSKGGNNYFSRCYIHLVEHARVTYFIEQDSTDGDAAHDRATDAAWCYFRELGFLLRIPA
jgi:hypothetical protein